jgi:HNH endonuclease
MPHGPTKFPSHRVCIYCGTADGRLTDEHVLPYSLGGEHILLAASCLKCADITKKFEQKVARDLWGDARSSYNARTRRKKERKREFILADPMGRALPVVVPSSQYPAAMVFYYMGRAGLLRGSDENIDYSPQWILKAIVDESRLQEFESKYPGRLTAQFRHVPDAFGRLLAKVAYCQILTSLAPNDFDAICLPYILGHKKNLSYIVGARTSIEDPEPGIGYRLSSNRFGTRTKQVLVAEIRLVANNHTPTYHVIVGKVEGMDRVSNVVERLDTRCSVDMPESFDIPREPPDDLHWMPRNWPLPIFQRAEHA